MTDISKLQKSMNQTSPQLKNTLTPSKIQPRNRFQKDLPKNTKYLNKIQSEKSLVEDILKANTDTKLENFQVNFDRELEDPDNQRIREEIEKLYHVFGELSNLEENFLTLKQDKNTDMNDINDSKIYDENTNSTIKYKFSPYLKGLQDCIDEFYANLEESYKQANLKLINKPTTHEKVIKTLTCDKKQDKALLENVYNLIGHEAYTKIIRIFEKYCYFGKTNSNFIMDFSQFSNFISSNNIDQIISKQQCEVLFNKVKTGSKAINFEEFIGLLLEIGKVLYPWETKPMNSFLYFLNKHVLSLPCLLKTEEEKLLDRFYYFLEYEAYKNEIKRHIGFLYKHFQNSKIKDQRLGEMTDINNFMKFAKEVGIIPVFLSGKEVSYAVNFIKYKKKSLIPNNVFDFCSFVEILCLISFQAFGKYTKEGEEMGTVEKIRNFFVFLKDK